MTVKQEQKSQEQEENLKQGNEKNQEKELNLKPVSQETVRQLPRVWLDLESRL
mgnify:CR=1 FL=1